MKTSHATLLAWATAWVLAFPGTTALHTADSASPNPEATEPNPTDPQPWNIEDPPWPTRNQPIDATEGTWINLDISPDGQSIVFDFLGDLYLMPVTGADGAEGNFPTRLTQGLAWDMQPRFSPDGLSIAFTSDRPGESKHAGDNIWIMSRDGGNLRQITDESFRLLNGPCWSPDGQYIVARKHFTSRRSLGSGEMWMYHRGGVEANGQAGVQLTETPNEQKDVNEPAFSPDGQYLYYSQDASPGDTFQYDKDSTGQIYVIKRLELATSETITYISGPGGACRPVPSPDGRTIAFVRRSHGKSGLHLFDTASGAVRLLYENLERDMQETWAIHGVYPAFAWTPDNHSLVVWARGKIRKIRVRDGRESVIPFHIRDERAVTEAVRFPVTVGPEEFPVKMLRWVRVSPRGNQVVYQALGHLYVRDLPQGEPRRLTSQSDHFEFYPSYSRDGRYIVYTTWHDDLLGTLRVASADPANPDAQWKVSSQPGHYIEPVFSPDGNTIVYVKSGGGHLRSPLWSRNQGVYRVAARGGEAERILKNGRHPQFAAENDRLYVLQNKREKDADNLALISVNLNGQEKQNHYTSPWATDFQLSPDGRWIAFIERFNVYLAPFVKTSKPVQVSPKAKALPIASLSNEAGNNIHFSGDSRNLHWSLGPTLFTRALTHSFTYLEGAPEKLPADPVSSQEIGMTAPHARPSGRIALVGGNVLTMGEAGLIENGVVVWENNRLKSVGPRAQTPIPPDTKTIHVDGQLVLPGFIDTHAHGAQATQGLTPQQNWVDYVRLAFGVTTIHDPSNDTQSIFAASELTKAGLINAPRTFSTGTILYGAAGSFKAEVASLEDALFHLKRMQAVGAFTVKSYNQPRRDQRQQILAAARQLGMMVVPEGGATFMHNLTMIVDGHTGIEHTFPVQSVYDDVLDLWRNTGVGYTPTLSVAYGGLGGENYWYEQDDLWRHDRLATFFPPHILEPRARRRLKAPEEDYNHRLVARIAKQSFDQGGLVQAGGHGQLSGLDTHWEMWSFVQGGMSPAQALQCGTLNGARYLGLDQDLGSLEPGKLADLIVIQTGFDPLKNIRHSEFIQYVVANGRLYEATTMKEIGHRDKPRRPFFWEGENSGVGQFVPPPPEAACLGCPSATTHLAH